MIDVDAVGNSLSSWKIKVCCVKESNQSPENNFFSSKIEIENFYLKISRSGCQALPSEHIFLQA